MKTLKKTLCLVLAVVMVVGALVLPASAAYKDVDKIDKDYKDAVTTLETWQIMLGDDTGNFKPEAHIQRQEMAAIVYRLLTGDNGGYGHDNSAIYIPLATAKFTDVGAKDWAAGYIGYCVNKGIIVGTNAEGTTFEPTRNIPGYDVLCMLLRAVGYGKNKEYQGADWAKHIAADATRLHLTEGITTKLNIESERQEVAQMTYKAATAARVTWSDAEKDYIPYVDPNDPNSTANIALIEKLADTTKTADADSFGNPGSTTVTHGIKFTYPVKAVPFTWTVTTAPAMKDYWTAVTECDVAHDIGITANKTFTTYTNGVKNVGSDTIEPLDMVNTIGHQGRHTLVYKDNGVIVYVDTYLARVTGTTVEVKDPAGHVITKATASLQVYSNHVANPNNATATVAPAATSATATATIDNKGYVVGDMLRVTVVTKDPYNAFGGTVTVATSEKVSTETVTIADVVRDAANWTPHGGAATTLTEVGFKGTNGKTYLYNYTYGYNTEAAPTTGASVQRILTSDIGKTYTVYVDTKGNVLGVDLNPISDIGVVTAVSTKALAINKFSVVYQVLMPDGKTVTVESLAADGRPYATSGDAARAAATFWGAHSTDAGILARITPVANGYYTVVEAGTDNNSYTGTLAANTALLRGEANAFAALTAGNTGTVTGIYPTYIGTPTSIQNILVDSTTLYFVANYGYNYTANEYQFGNFTITTGFKSVTDMSYISTPIPNASTAPTPSSGTANIDGQTAATLNLEVSAFDVDTDGYADFVLVLNDNQQRIPNAIPVLNYAYLMTNRQFASTGNDHNVFGAIINGTANQTLTVTAVAASNVQNTGLYTYNQQTVNGWDAVTYVNDSAATPYYGVAAGTVQGWLEKDDVLVVAPTQVAAGASQNRANVADKFLTIADNCVVYLVNPTTGASTQQTYDLSTLDDANVYGTNAIAYQFDANGYVNLIYIVAKGGPETNRDPATQIQSVTLSTTGKNAYGEPTACPITTAAVTPAAGNYVAPTVASVSAAGQWYYLDTDPAVADWKVAGATFVSPYTYKLVVTLTAADGYVFVGTGLTVSGIFAGMTASTPVISNNGKTATITYTF